MIRDNLKGSVHLVTDNVYLSSVSVESVKIITNTISMREECLEDLKKGKVKKMCTAGVELGHT